jgi:hypothetical protein
MKESVKHDISVILFSYVTYHYDINIIECDQEVLKKLRMITDAIASISLETAKKFYRELPEIERLADEEL